VPQTDKTDMPLAKTRYTGVQRAKKDLVFKIRCLLISEKILPTVVVIQLSNIIIILSLYIIGCYCLCLQLNSGLQRVCLVAVLLFVFCQDCWLFVHSITCMQLDTNNNTIITSFDNIGWASGRASGL